MSRIVPAIFFVFLGGIMVWQVLTNPGTRVFSPGDPGPWAFPALVAFGLILFGLFEGLRQFNNARREASADNTSDSNENPDLVMELPPVIRVRFAFGVVACLYIAFFQQVGFTISTAAFLTVSIFLLGKQTPRSTVAALLVGVTSSLLIGWLLVGLVKVSLPGVLLI